MKLYIYSILTLLLMAICKNGYTQEIPYRDITHQSQVFGHEKTYRLYLPEDYSESDKAYPVIYFFHGWGGRYFKDPSAKPEYELIGDLVNKYRFILVMWDGSMDEAEPRPYNTGNHQDVKYPIQMKDYFPELVSHIDSEYRTLTDRNNRGIIGFSMGGFMASYLAGKYSDKVSAAVSLTGSPEFYIGYPDNHTLYPVRYTFDNLRDVGFLLHNRTECPMAGLNEEVGNAIGWSGLHNAGYLMLPGPHMMDEPGETKIFESAIKFVFEQFENPVPPGETWSHYDLYPEFEKWGYTVTSNKSEPGFLYLRNVSPDGFGFYTFKWLPDGKSIKNCLADITTAPLYKPESEYEVNVFYKSSQQIEIRKIVADKEGRLTMQLSGEGCEVGIKASGKNPRFVVAGYQLNDGKKYLRVNTVNLLKVNLFGREGGPINDGELTLTLTSNDSLVSIKNPSQKIILRKGVNPILSNEFRIEINKQPPPDGSPPWVRFTVEIEYQGKSFTDNFVVPVWYDVPAFQNVEIVRHSAPDPESGEKVSVAAPSNRISVFEEGHRLKLYVDDPCVLADEEIHEYEVLPAHWPDGFSPVSSVKIADSCPSGHVIEFLGHYDTKTWNPIYRQVKWGKVRVKVKE
jgi:pimeloyl-ACP methyl ester carboxylesterase